MMLRVLLHCAFLCSILYAFSRGCIAGTADPHVIGASHVEIHYTFGASLMPEAGRIRSREMVFQNDLYDFKVSAVKKSCSCADVSYTMGVVPKGELFRIALVANMSNNNAGGYFQGICVVFFSGGERGKAKGTIQIEYSGFVVCGPRVEPGILRIHKGQSGAQGAFFVYLPLLTVVDGVPVLAGDAALSISSPLGVTCAIDDVDPSEAPVPLSKISTFFPGADLIENPDDLSSLQKGLYGIYITVKKDGRDLWAVRKVTVRAGPEALPGPTELELRTAAGVCSYPVDILENPSLEILPASICMFANDRQRGAIIYLRSNSGTPFDVHGVQSSSDAFDVRCRKVNTSEAVIEVQVASEVGRSHQKGMIGVKTSLGTYSVPVTYLWVP